MKKSTSTPCLTKLKLGFQPLSRRNSFSCNSLASLGHDISLINDLSVVFHSPIHQTALCLNSQSSTDIKVAEILTAPELSIMNEDLASCLLTPSNDDEQQSVLREREQRRAPTVNYDLLERLRRRRRREACSMAGSLP